MQKYKIVKKYSRKNKKYKPKPTKKFKRTHKHKKYINICLENTANTGNKINISKINNTTKILFI